MDIDKFECFVNPQYPHFYAKVIADSISPSMKRIFTVEVRFPRFMLAELNTHRVISKNSASSRAVPLTKMIAAVETAAYIPIYWGKNQRGMQSGAELDEVEKRIAEKIWLDARDLMVAQCKKLGGVDAYVFDSGEICANINQNDLGLTEDTCVYNLNVHKETVNRLLEPFMWHTALLTSTEWANFFALRTHKKASPAFRIIASLIADAFTKHSPHSLEVGEWHLPYADDTKTRKDIVKYLNLGKPISWITPQDVIDALLKVSTGRCARLSYLNQDNQYNIESDIKLYTNLADRTGINPFEDPSHASPLEHQACAMDDESSHSGNFKGWKQHRKLLRNECIEEFVWKGYTIGWQH